MNKTYQEDAKTIYNCVTQQLSVFQQRTVERVTELFNKGQKKVLVADEVGLGKTYIAKGVIAEEILNIQKNVYKIVYICSNQSLAKQNIEVINVLKEVRNKKECAVPIKDTRLSMQHYKIEDEKQNGNKDIFIKLIPLTPGTSSLDDSKRVTTNMDERALMFAVLERCHGRGQGEKSFSSYTNELHRIFSYQVNVVKYKNKKEWEKSSWLYATRKYQNKVEKLNEQNPNYPGNIIEYIRKKKIKTNEGVRSLEEYVLETCKVIKKTKCSYRNICSSCINEEKCHRSEIIKYLKQAFSEASIDLLKPDLVIMDEFQRFDNMIKTKDDDNSSSYLIKEKLLEAPDRKVLMLSATPYTMYVNGDNQADYEDFINLIHFLFKNEPLKFDNFDKSWEYFNKILDKHDFKNFKTAKQKAEEALYEGVCRTERNCIDNGKIDIQETIPQIIPTTAEVISYMNMEKLFSTAGLNVYIEYIKSCPYLLSFMKYKIKDNLIAKLSKDSTFDFSLLNKDYIWLDEDKIRHYEQLPGVNQKFELLKEKVLTEDSHLLLWIPPTLPYYNLEGPFKGKENFTKTLIFSSREMVPRMISSLLSYEYERKLFENTNYSYFSEDAKKDDKKKKPIELYKLSVKHNHPEQMIRLALLYPSKTLCSTDIFNPVACLQQKDLNEIIEEVQEKIKQKLLPLKKYETRGERTDRWYYLAPMLLDGIDVAKQWCLQFTGTETEEDNRVQKHFNHLNTILNTKLKLGTMPIEKLSRYLALLTIGGFANCYYRACKKLPNADLNATNFALRCLNYFNTEIAAAVIKNYPFDLNKYGKIDSQEKLLIYCIEGCFQGMLDEYIFTIRGEGDIQEKLLNVFKAKKASPYHMDNYDSFMAKVEKERNKDAKIDIKDLSMRGNFALCYIKDVSTKTQNQEEDEFIEEDDSIEALREKFNSPLLPFVLSTTSIGQDGLDFHKYCRRIMHWNIPHNPIDLEQREGRINRRLCLSVRQSLAEYYKTETFDTDDIWKEMFDKAKEKLGINDDSGLVPYWSLGNKQKQSIERFIPLYDMSTDLTKYEILLKKLLFYRISLGNPHQEELIQGFSECTPEERKLLEDFINLCPYLYSPKASKTIGN